MKVKLIEICHKLQPNIYYSALVADTEQLQ